MNKPDNNLRQRFLAKERLTGTFLKIAHTMPAETCGSVGYDFVVIDEEHAPISRESTDQIVLACKAYGLGCLVRVQSDDPAAILSAIDCGADGVLVPHINSSDKAQRIVAAARYQSGSRGYSATTRAGDFGRKPMHEHIKVEDERVLVIAMVEDPEAVKDIDAIVQVQGLDGVFIGRGDLTVAYGETRPGSEPVKAAAQRIAHAAKDTGIGIAALASGVHDARSLAALDVTAFIIGSDQAFLRDAAQCRLDELRNAISEMEITPDGF